MRILEKDPPDFDTALKVACRLEAFGRGSPVAGRAEAAPDILQRSREKYNRVVAECDKNQSNTGFDATIFKQFQEGLKHCMNQMTAYRKEMEDLRRQIRVEGSRSGQSSSTTTESRSIYGGSYQGTAKNAQRAGGPTPQPVVGDAAPGNPERVSSRYEGLVTDVEKKDIGRGPVLIEGRAAAIIRRLPRKEKKALNGNHEYKLWVSKR